MKRIINGLSHLTKFFKSSSFLSAFLFITTASLHAEPTVGFGLSISFGQEKVDAGVGIRLLSDNRQDTTVGSIGLDYMLGSQSLRGTVGVAQLFEDTYMSLELGVGVSSGNFSFGVGLGLSETAHAPSDTLVSEDQNEGPQDVPDLEISDFVADSPPPIAYDPQPFIEYPDNYIPLPERPQYPWEVQFAPADFDLGLLPDNNGVWSGAGPENQCWQC